MELFGELFNTIEERVEPLPTKLKGQWPAWLRGSFLRVGPGKYDLGDFTLNHWLDGMAILHKFHIDGGKVSFRSKYLRSDAYKKACMAQRPVFTEFGTHCYPDPCKNIFSRMFSHFEMTDNASNNILCVEDQLFVSSETCYIRKIDPNTLDTRDKVDLNKVMGVNFASSHPLTDDSGTTYNMGCSFMSGPKYNIVRIPPSKDSNLSGSDPWINARTLTTVSSSWKASYAYYHSFGMSENYLVFLEQPLLVSTLKLATSQLKNRALTDCFDWLPQERVKFIVIRKSTGEVVKVKYISEEAFFTFHHVNAYEVEGQLVVDLVAYPSPEIINKLYLKKVRMNEYSSEDPPQLKRFILPLVSDLQSVKEGEELVHVAGNTASAIKVKNNQDGVYISVTGVDVGEPGFEMPVINTAHTGKPYRFVYGTGAYDQGYFKNSVCKMDVESGRSWVWRGNEHQYLSEPSFIPAPDAIDEDDGVILCSVADVRKGSPDFLLVVDARTMKELGRAEVDARIPTSLHGVFLPERH
ncbi:beta,beta-carotene 15,15'-dioxygenase [Procambarus clarkii]|uniref:beta,beta-carotene 15,15'-dioxygenase n=1 Tax=Procambarus clarkii TaxID=6728 RepID=UPI001E6722D0|nr:beta,beta-carotene 15,15'-dioxygenase-like [Procambarus clarkii]